MKTYTYLCGFLGLTAALATSCSYNDIYQPWFDEDQPLYEHELQPVPATTPITSESAAEVVAPTPEAVNVAAPVAGSPEAEAEMDSEILQPVPTSPSPFTEDPEDQYVQIPIAVLTDSPTPAREIVPKAKVAPAPTPAPAPATLSGASKATPAVSFLATKIPYGAGSSKLDSRDKANLKETAEVCLENGCTIHILPYASQKNPNQAALAKARANNIKKALVQYGIPASDIIIDNMNSTGDFSEVFVEY